MTINRGVWTELELERAPKWRITVEGLGARIKGEVSRKVVELLMPKISIPHHVHVKHRFEVPVGAGYGASGGGALGVALALNEALNLGLHPLEAANVAHLAEIECMTGLGTVLAETYGGFSLRVKPGGPSLGEVKKFKVGSRFRVVSLCWGGLPTKKALSSPAFKRKVKRIGEGCLEKFEANPTVRNFLEVSRDFAEALKLPSQRVRAALDFLASKGFRFSMNMLGEAIFTLVGEEEVDGLLRLLGHPLFEGCRLTVSEVSEEGVRLEG